MATAELRKDIKKCEQDMDNLVMQLEALRHDIVKAIKPFIKEKIKSIVEDEIRHNSDLTKSLGKDRLSEFKSKLMSILEVSDELVDNIYGTDVLWLHIGYTFNSGHSSCEKEKKAQENIADGMRVALGYAGQLLIDFGYTKMPTTDRYSSSNWSLIDGKIALPRNLYFQRPTEIDKLSREYSSGIEKLYDLLQERERLSNRLSEQEALDLWNQA